MPETDQTTTDQQQETTEETDDVAGLKSALQSERDARKELAKSLKDVKAELATLRSSGQSDADKLKTLEAERNEIAAKLRERDARDAVLTAAKAAGAPDPAVVYRFIKSDLEYDKDDGTPTNLKTLIDDAKATAPQLFKASTGKADGAAGNGSKPKHFDMNAQIRAMAGRET